MTYSPVRLGATGVTRVLTNLSYGDLITNAYNLTGGIATATSLYVSGITTLGGASGITTTYGDFYVGAGKILSAHDVSVLNTLTVQTALYTNLTVSGIATFSNPIKYVAGNYYAPNGIAYFTTGGNLVSAAATTDNITTSNLLLTVDAVGTPYWTTVLDGGEY